MLIYWAFIQFAGGLSRIGVEGEGGVAFWAHVGGFVAGLVLVKLFASATHLQSHRRTHWTPAGRRGW
jgi:membrane associated rhomboid family serine protease